MTPTDNPSPGQFPTTRWSRVIAAGNRDALGNGDALAGLCNAYWYPLYAYIRRRGHTPEQAQDLTQEFFAYVLERDLFAKADPDRGRFRSFLRAVCDHQLADLYDRQKAQKRGGGRTPLPIDALEAEGRYSREPADEMTPDRIFDRSWALTLLNRVLERLRQEYRDAGRAATFDALRVVLVGGPESVSHATIAERLGTSEGAVRVAVHRLRRRYGALLRQEIAGTVDDPAEIDDEIRALFAALES